MKIITLWQPWATLIALELKRYETRSWGTDYRGPLAIHAAKRPMGKVEYFAWLDILQEVERSGSEPKNLPLFNHLPLGAIVAIAELSSCHRMSNLKKLDSARCGSMSIDSASLLERKCGDWQSGRYAWKLEQVHELEAAINFKGGQGLRDLPVDIAQQIAASPKRIATS
jgi:hypothetical protein